MKTRVFKGRNTRKNMGETHSNTRGGKTKNMKEETEPPSGKQNGIIREYINILRNRNTDRHISNSLLLVHQSPIGCPVGYFMLSSNSNRILRC